jgi:putative ABC transport system permease protein
MLKHYLLIALRSLRRQKGFAAINVLGLAVGIAGALLVGLFVRGELTFDRFHDDVHRVFRVWTVEAPPSGEVHTNIATAWPLGPLMASSMPEVEAVTRVQFASGALRRGTHAFPEDVAVVDASFLDVFTFPVVAGDRATALAQPGGVVLTDSTARQLFGGADPVGQPVTLRWRDTDLEAVVAAVVHVPATSSLRFDVLLPFERARALYPPGEIEQWGMISPETFVRLREGASSAAAEAALPALVRPHRRERTAAFTVHLQPLTRVHLDTTLPRSSLRVRDPATLWILAAIAGLVLLVACINFTTLALGRSLERAREVGVRKALGAHHAQLMGQFWAEAGLLSLLALAAGAALARLGRPLFERMAEQPIPVGFDAATLLLMASVAVGTALGAGAYPALVLSRFQPTETLRGRVRLGAGGGVQRALVALQFALSIALVASTLVMASQLRFLQTKRLGYEPDRVVRLPDVAVAEEGLDGLAGLRATLEAEPAVAAVSAVAFPLAASGELGWVDEQDETRRFRFNGVAPDVLEALQIRLEAGPGFAAEPATAAHQAVVNRAFVEAFAIEDPVGAPMPGPFGAHYTIAGVTEDFHFASLHEAVAPLALFTRPDSADAAADLISLYGSPSPDVLVRLGPGPLPDAMAAVERAFAAALPGRAFDYEFLDDALDRQYRDEARMRAIVRLASLLAVLIAALGVFGLAALATAQRTKEVGVRKVLGASVADLVVLLSKDLARLVLVGFVLAVPVAWWLMRGWLEGYAYRIALGPQLFLAAGALALAVALAAASVHTLRAALADPVEALRSE